MSKFNVGDRVKCVATEILAGGRIAKIGDIFTVTGTDTPRRYGSMEWRLVLGHEFGSDTLENFEPVSSLDNLSIDDVLVDDCGFEYTILDVHGKVVDLADSDGHFAYSVTVKELRDNDFTVRGAEPEPRPTELTLQQIADKMGLPVEQIRIKE